MKLYYNATSPYTRKVRITAMEKGLELETINANPFEENPDLKAVNPLGAVPTLITENGESFYDSPVICAYLNSLSPEPNLIPEGPDYWTILRAQALTDGITDAAFLMVMESRRPEEQQSTYWNDRRTAVIMRSVNTVENNLPPFKGNLTIAQIGLGSALGYLDFRLPHINWREGNERTEQWFTEFSKRKSMIETKPE